MILLLGDIENLCSTYDYLHAYSAWAVKWKIHFLTWKPLEGTHKHQNVA